MKTFPLHAITLALLALTGAAQAQQSSNVDKITVTGEGDKLGAGLMVDEDAPKARSTVTKAVIDKERPGSNPFQALTYLPGVNASSLDATGLFGGNLRVRGFNSDQMGFTINGAPVNDSGNFAVYPQEYTDSENLCEIFITQGATDTEAPPSSDTTAPPATTAAPTTQRTAPPQTAPPQTSPPQTFQTTTPKPTPNTVGADALNGDARQVYDALNGALGGIALEGGLVSSAQSHSGKLASSGRSAASTNLCSETGFPWASVNEVTAQGPDVASVTNSLTGQVGSFRGYTYMGVGVSSGAGGVYVSVRVGRQ